MEKSELTPGRLVQLDPRTEGNKAFAGCIMVVTKCKEWGAQGYVQALGEKYDVPGRQAYYNANWEDMELVGHAKWIVPLSCHIANGRFLQAEP